MVSTHVDIENTEWTGGAPFYGPAAVHQGKDIVQLVFDARLVAVMLAHGVARLLTFNGADFAGLGIVVLEPQAVRST